MGSTWEIFWEIQVLSSFIVWLQGTADLTIYGAMSWKSTVVGGKYFEGYWLHSQEWDSCIHAWSNLTSRWTKSSVSRGVQNAQSVGALLPHHSAQSYGSGLALETKLCVRGYEPNAAMIHRRQHGAASGEGAADESAAGTDATAVAEHALALVPGDRSQCGKPPTCLCFSTWPAFWHPKNWSVSSFSPMVPIHMAIP